ncbi:MAG: hypothetical protein JW900_01750 [Anaerolineae bacterium]|nr:hypothetical protein [Anaerolineae bacterium]
MSEGVKNVHWKRLIVVLALSGVVALGLMLLPASAEPEQFKQGWEVIYADDFEGAFPGSWIVMDDNPTNGEYYWYAETYTYTSFYHSAWCVGGGADGRNLDPAADAYPDGVDSWMLYGPIDLSQVFGGQVTFDWWLDAAPPGSMMGEPDLPYYQVDTAPGEGDWLGWCVTTDHRNPGASCDGGYISGHIGAWLSGTLSLQEYARSDTPVWIAFHFVSDEDGVTGQGAFVDNVVLSVDHGYAVAIPLIRRDASPTPVATNTPTATPTPVPSPTPPYYYDDFTDPGSGWPDDEGEIPNEQGWDVHWRRGYVGTTYYHFEIEEGPAPWVWFWQPDALSPYRPPSDTYCIETEVWFETPGWWANAGLIFGADEANSDLYILCLGVGESELGWHVTRNDEYEFPRGGCAFDAGVIARGGSYGLVWDGWNELRVSVEGDQITVYINDINFGSWGPKQNPLLSDLSETTRIGLIGGDYEVSPTDAYFRYIQVIPNAPCAP